MEDLGWAPQMADPWKPLGLFILDIFVQRYRLTIWDMSAGYIMPYIVSHAVDGVSNLQMRIGSLRTLSSICASLPEVYCSVPSDKCSARKSRICSPLGKPQNEGRLAWGYPSAY